MRLSPHLYAFLAFLLFALMNSCIKALHGAVPVPLALTIRFLVGFWCFYPLVRREGGFSTVLKTTHRIGHMGRAIFGLLAVALSFYTLPLIPLSDANALGQTYPFFLMLLSIPILGETAKPKQFLPLLLGFAGVIVIAKPHGNTGFLPAILMMISAVSAAGSDLIVRRLARTDKSLTIVVWFFLLAGAISFFWWLPDARAVQINSHQALLLLAAGICGGVAQLCLTHAFKHLPASIIGPYSYLGFFWATMCGWIFFKEVPTLSVLIGMGLIIGGVQLNYALSYHRHPKR